MTALYEIADEYVKALSHLQEIGCDQKTIEDTLSPITGSFEEKARNVTAWINNCDCELSQLEEHAKNIKSRIDSRKKQIAYFREYLKNNMKRMGIKSIKSPFFEIILKDSIPKLEIDDPLLIPTDYIKSETITKIDEPTIKIDLRNGRLVAGASLIPTKALQIKIKDIRN